VLHINLLQWCLFIHSSRRVFASIPKNRSVRRCFSFPLSFSIKGTIRKLLPRPFPAPVQLVQKHCMSWEENKSLPLQYEAPPSSSSFASARPRDLLFRFGQSSPSDPKIRTMAGHDCSRLLTAGPNDNHRVSQKVVVLHIYEAEKLLQFYTPVCWNAEVLCIICALQLAFTMSAFIFFNSV